MLLLYRPQLSINNEQLVCRRKELACMFEGQKHIFVHRTSTCLKLQGLQNELPFLPRLTQHKTKQQEVLLTWRGVGPSRRKRSRTPLSATQLVLVPSPSLLTSTNISAAFNLHRQGHTASSMGSCQTHSLWLRHKLLCGL